MIVLLVLLAAGTILVHEPVPIERVNTHQPEIHTPVLATTPITIESEPDDLPPALREALYAYAEPADITQWRTILACETTGYDNSAVGAAGEISVAQIHPMNLPLLGMTPFDLITYDGAMRAAVMLANAASETRDDKFWPWTTRGGC